MHDRTTEPSRERSTMLGGSCGEGSVHSDTIVRWNTAKELPSHEASKKELPESPRMKRDVRFNLPEINFSHDDGRLGWMPSESQHHASSATRPHESADNMLPPRADSVATHILDNSLARANHILRLRKQARQERRALKESGDYLGVQGVNPETGRLDVETPTDSDESQPGFGGILGSEIRQKFLIGSFDQDMTEKEKKVMLLKAHEDELRRMEKSKQEAEELANQLMWRRYTKECDSQIKNISDESLDSTSRNGRESCGTVVRTPHHRSLGDVSRAALELFENGISFDRSFRSKRTGNGSSSRYESSEAVSPTTKVERDASHIRSSTLQPFLGKYREYQGSQDIEKKDSSHRTVTRKTFREMSHSLRTKTSLTNILMASPSARLQTMAKKHMMRKVDSTPATNQPLVGAWIEDLIQTELAKPKPPSLPAIEFEEPLRMIAKQQDSNLWIEGHLEKNMFAAKTRRTEAQSSVSTPNEVRQEMENFQENLLKRDSAATGKENCKIQDRKFATSVDTGGIEATMKGINETGESACTYITITTGSMRVKAVQSKDFNELEVSKQQNSAESYLEMKSKNSSKTEDTPANTPNDTAYPVSTNHQQDAKQYVLKTTRGANRIQLRQKKVAAEAQNAELSPSTTNCSNTVTPPAQKSMLKVGFLEERKKQRVGMAIPAATPTATPTAEPSAIPSTAQEAQAPTSRKHCGGCSECLRIPGGFPAHLIEDDAIAPHSVNSEAAQARQMAQLRRAFDCTLGQFVAAIELYCRVVWPVFDPYSSLWERNAETQTTILDVIVLVLAVPGAIVAIAMAAWGLRAMAAVCSIVYDAIKMLGKDALSLSGF
ncbi:hypothetical protein PWT90_02159 [Aphanocladium album]|nr:hypothetical protein PWT90_02159 [Aphanocladium album]